MFCGPLANAANTWVEAAIPDFLIDFFLIGFENFL